MNSMLFECKAILQSAYGIAADTISPAEGGWSALACKVDSPQGTYFLSGLMER